MSRMKSTPVIAYLRTSSAANVYMRSNPRRAQPIVSRQPPSAGRQAGLLNYTDYDACPWVHDEKLSF